MSYKTFDTWQFAEDKYFVDWVLKPDKHSEEFWQSFLKENPNKVQDILIAREIVSGVDYKNAEELDDEQYVSLFDRILSNTRKESSSDLRTTHSDRTIAFVKLAAVIFMVICLGVIWLYNDYLMADTSKEIEYATIESPLGSQITTILSDGTKVRLNGGSFIKYSKPFVKASERSLYLEGEAFFDVSRDESRPFRVKTEYVNTEVLGTSFNVKAYPNKEEVSVAVAEGKVKVISSKTAKFSYEHTLNPLEESRLNLKTNLAQKRILEDESVFAWTRWELIFKNDQLGVILENLEKWYAIEVEVAPGIDLKEKFSGRFNNDPLKVVLEAFKSQKAFDYKLTSDKVVLITKYDKNDK